MPEIIAYSDSVKAGRFQTLRLSPFMRNPKMPWYLSGTFGVVFHMKDQGSNEEYAVKCFRLPVSDRMERFRRISDDLTKFQAHCFTEFVFMENEIEVKNSQGQLEPWPILRMSWQQGETLTWALDSACRTANTTKISELHEIFEKFVKFLADNGLGHGDLKGDNLIVSPFGLIGLDLDGMYVPSLAGWSGIEAGTPWFQHPNRTNGHFSEKMDWFSVRVMRAAFLALIKKPELWGRFSELDNGIILFRRADFEQRQKNQPSPIFTELRSLTDPAIDAILDELEESLATGDVEGINVTPRWQPGMTAAAAQAAAQQAAQAAAQAAAAATAAPAATSTSTPVQPAPIAAFAATGNIGVAPLLVKFINQSRDATSYRWDFGDGTTSTEKNPTHRYDQDGVYDVVLEVSGPGGTDTCTLPALVQVQAAAQQAAQQAAQPTTQAVVKATRQPIQIHPAQAVLKALKWNLPVSLSVATIIVAVVVALLT